MEAVSKEGPFDIFGIFVFSNAKELAVKVFLQVTSVSLTLRF